MGAVIKKVELISVTGNAVSEVMRKPVFAQTRSINNGEKKPAQVKNADGANGDTEEAPGVSEEELLQKKAHEDKIKEYEKLRQQYIDQGEKLLNEARIKASDIKEDAEIHAQLIREGAEKESVEIKKKAEEEGYTAGFQSGEEPGYKEGYNKGLVKCKDTLLELNAILKRLPAEKEDIFADYENQLFNLIFTISNKITVGSLKQKDKAVISKMLKEAAKSFRGSSYIKVSLSKLDIEEAVNVDLDDLTRIFGTNQHIEFEVLKEAPKGTLILDNGSEITDAGIQTQLKMIENLGKGKFKNNPDGDKAEDDDIVDSI